MTVLPRLSLADQAAERLEARIASGEWPIGAKLPAEPELMAELGVGRSTVREAIRTLSRVGLVQVRQGDGTRVTGLPGEDETLSRRCQRADLNEIHDVRVALDLQAARLAAERRTESDVVRLRAQLAARNVAVRARDAAAFAEADVAFHEGIVAAAGNAMLSDVYRLISDGLRASLTRYKQETHFDDVDTASEHAALLDAIEARDARAAVTAVHTLFSRGRHVLTTIGPAVTDLT